MTGEDIPSGQSLRARLNIVEVSPGDIRTAPLTACQKDAADGRYAEAMSTFLEWLAPQYTEVAASLAGRVEEYRQRLVNLGLHARTPTNVAQLAVGLRYFLDFAVAVEALTPTDASHLWDRGWAALIETGRAQAAHVESAEPTRQFRALITAVLVSGRAYVASRDGSVPDSPQALGWKPDDEGGWRPQGHLIGWAEDQDLYLEPDSSYAAVQQLAHDQGEHFAIAARTLWKRLDERRHLASTGASEGRTTVKVRRTIDGNRRDVIHLPIGFLGLGAVTEVTSEADSDLEAHDLRGGGGHSAGHIARPHPARVTLAHDQIPAVPRPAVTSVISSTDSRQGSQPDISDPADFMRITI